MDEAKRGGGALRGGTQRSCVPTLLPAETEMDAFNRGGSWVSLLREGGRGAAGEDLRFTPGSPPITLAHRLPASTNSLPEPELFLVLVLVLVPCPS